MIGALWRDGAVYALGTIISRGIAFVLLPLVARTLSPADFGVFDLVLAVGVLVNIVVPLETGQALARFWNERADAGARRRLAATAFTFTLAGHAAFAAVVVLAAAPLSQALLGEASHAGALRAGACTVAANGVFAMLQGQFRWELRPRAFAFVSTVYAAASLLFVSAAALVGAGALEPVLWAYAGAAIVASALAAVALRGSLGLGIDLADLRAMLRYALPLVPAGVAMFAAIYVNRLMLNGLATLADVGAFGVASRIANLATLVLLGVQTALTPLVYAHHAEPGTPAAIARLFEGFVAVALIACLALALYGPELVALVGGGDYAGVAPLLGWLGLAALLTQMYIFAPGIAIAKRTGLQLAVTAAGALSGVGLSAWWIPRFGIAGATAATVAAALVFFVGWLACNQRLYPLPLRAARLAIAASLFVVLAASAPVLGSWLPHGAAGWAAKACILAFFVACMAALGMLRLPARRGRAPAERS